MRLSKLVGIFATLALSGSLASTAHAQGQATVDRFAAPGPNAVDVIALQAFTLFVPRTRTGSEPILTWANGTGATPGAYSGLLTNYASHGIFVVASNSTRTGTGLEVRDGIDLALSMTTTELICTAGHSQGGSGSVNAAGDLRVDCAMPIEPDNIFTAMADGIGLTGKLTLIVCGTADNLAPCGTAGATRNGSGLFNQSRGPAIQVFGDMATHFTPVGPGQNAFTGVTTAFLAASLLGDADARALFLGTTPRILEVNGFVMERFKGTDDPNLVVATDGQRFLDSCNADPTCRAAVTAAAIRDQCRRTPACVAAVQQELARLQLVAFVQACSADPACTAAIVAALAQGS
jgi:hypothetical protein